MKYVLADTSLALFLSIMVGCTATSPIDTGGDASGSLLARGETLFTAQQVLDSVSSPSASCAQCHEADGSGGRTASIRGSSAAILQDFAQGEANHPALSGGRPDRVPQVKFPELDAADFDAIEAFLASS